MAGQKPSIGRIVIFCFANGEVCPAVITRVWSDVTVNLHLLRDHNQMQIQLDQGNYPTSVMLGEGENRGGPRTWHWPERVG